MAKKIADKLRERIRFRHATHEEIAKRAKLPPETVSNFMEHGEISLDDAEILLETLDSWREYCGHGAISESGFCRAMVRQEWDIRKERAAQRREAARL